MNTILILSFEEWQGRLGNYILSLYGMVQFVNRAQTLYPEKRIYLHLSPNKYMKYFTVPCTILKEISSDIKSIKVDASSLLPKKYTDEVKTKYTTDKLDSILHSAVEKGVGCIYFKAPILGEFIYRYNFVPFQKAVRFKPCIPLKLDGYLDREKNKIGIHIREFADVSSNYTFEYYSDAIDQLDIENSIVYIGGSRENQTPITHYTVYQKILNKLREKKVEVIELESYQKNNSLPNEIVDFYIFSQMNHLISSNSTFSICAGYMGITKTISHNSYFVRKRASIYDTYWYDLYNLNVV